jgi:hypothetical protein
MISMKSAERYGALLQYVCEGDDFDAYSVPCCVLFYLYLK